MTDLIVEAETDSSRGIEKTLENKGRETLGNIGAFEIQHNPIHVIFKVLKRYPHHIYLNFQQRSSFGDSHIWNGAFLCHFLISVILGKLLKCAQLQFSFSNLQNDNSNRMSLLG